MKILFALLSLLLLGLAPATSISPQSPADLVFINGNIYTGNEKQPRAEAVAVKGDRIVFVGSNAAAKKLEGATTRVVDLHGATMVPGMADAHQHLEGVGFREMTLNLEGITNLQDFLAKVKARVDQAKPGEWVTGRGWIETFWTPPVFPTRWDLDKVAPNNPVILGRSDGHGTVVNSAALKIAGITKDTPSPFGGEISKDKQSGEPNGMLLDAAQGLVRRHVPPTSGADAERAVVLGVQRDIGLGWTQVQNPGGSYEDIDIYRKLYGEGKIKLRIYKVLSAPGKEAQRLLSEGPIIGAYGNRLTVRALKFYADGSLG
jgi:predicted amidohydrolase YtcJ